MGEYIQQLPDKIKPHVEEITKSSGLPQSEESLEMIAKCWLEKRKMFDEQIGALRMEAVESLSKESPKGALLLTYSGSLLSLGTVSGGSRYAEYASIGLRRDVPDVAKKDRAELEGDLIVDRVAAFKEGPVRSSSPLFSIAVCGDDVSLEEQDNRIREATIFLTSGFLKINRTHISAPEEGLGQFSMKSMVSYVAAKNGLTQKLARQVVEDFLRVVESGVLLGERVKLGRLGKLFLRKRGARKARVGRHPITGEEITVRASAESLVPKASFSKEFRQKAMEQGMEPERAPKAGKKAEEPEEPEGSPGAGGMPEPAEPEGI